MYNLPKWPALLVKGKKVTKEQAAEIIIRTDGLSFYSNDREFEKELNYELYGFHLSDMDIPEAAQKQYGGNGYGWMKGKISEYFPLDLHYLHNSRIVSSWVGGPHGWCNWDGYIGCNNYNIGKYPSVEEVERDWKAIAKAFPFLELRSQLLSGESCDENTVPVVEFKIENGAVSTYEPKELLDYTTDNTHTDVMNILFNPIRERGCSIQQFKEALLLVRQKFTDKIE